MQKFIHDHIGITIASRSRPGFPGGPLEYLWHAFNDADPLAPTPARDSVVWACRGGGKTMLGALATVTDLVFNPGIQVRILAGSMQQAARMHAHLRMAFAKPTLERLVRGRITDRKLELNNGSRVELLAQSQTAVRGTRVHRLRCDEVDLFDPEVWDAAQLVTRSEILGDTLVRGSIEALSTMHMPFGLMHTIVESCAQGTRTLFKWGIPEVLAPCTCNAETSARCAVGPECAMRQTHQPPHAADADLPPVDAGHVSIEDATRQKGRVPPEVWESEMLCIRPSRRETVFPEFEEHTHVIDDLPPWLSDRADWIGGMDFGFRTSALLWAAHEPESNALYIVDERVAHNALLRDHIASIKSGTWPVPRWLGVDPAGRATSDQSGHSNIELLRQSGLHVVSRNMETRAGLELVRTRLRPAYGESHLFVHRRCAHLIAAMRSYHFDPNDPQRQRPVKDGHDHIADALRYLVVCLDKSYAARPSQWA